MILLVGESLDQSRGRLRCQFGGGGIDDGEHGLLLRGEELVEGRLALAPGEILGNELVDVGVDGEMAGGVDAGDKAKKYSNTNNLSGVSGTVINRGDNRLLQHALS